LTRSKHKICHIYRGGERSLCKVLNYILLANNLAPTGFRVIKYSSCPSTSTEKLYRESRHDTTVSISRFAKAWPAQLCLPAVYGMNVSVIDCDLFFSFHLFGWNSVGFLNTSSSRVYK